MAVKKIAKRIAPAPVKSVAKKVPGNGAVPRPNNSAPAPVKGVAKKMVPMKKVAAPVKAAPKKLAPTKAAAPKRARDDDDDDEYQPTAADLRAGWSAAQETIDSTSTWAVAFRPTTQQQIIKILQASPYASFRRHWIRRVNGMRAYVCLQSFNRDCPLCDVGDRASAVSSFNVALCGDDGEAVLKSWDCGVRITQSLRTFSNDPKIGPLDKGNLYFAVSKTESTNRQQSQTLVQPVRARDLAEDYNIDPLDDEQIERLLEKAYTNEVVQMTKRSELEAVADELMNEDGSPSSGWGG